MNLNTLNTMPISQAGDTFRQCCAATGWVDGMVRSRPYATLVSILNTSDHIWMDMRESDLLEAFSAHPQIGNVDSLRQKYASTKAMAAGEQASVQQATEETIQALVKGNAEYLEKFGFIFIVCATGKSADEMLALLHARLPNSRPQELQNAAEEQHKITALRLEKLFSW
ncbi:2-oxo-4-hydroxy-4-carboxy-5-ureidoimidazoline decarboxylase [Ketobacter sp. MCCC 1A13808]|uniref:2-oxo-4-hydroxy-4-carboxy-5-ureidoimidazoline decarboxylase n=1 Tax=Ketobacter sp. MCCC 1A13808 TaxID=2602738 RepID=UPI000F2C3D10|nr:2-oxo-4-hydroxy-4-carboxy-5-ureidoimidazoline decarboxylase [Ketobacter sp. MCCC 1A13808]MVF12063.1 2-oxo-4-hydroxy-4-carboxy-5-ureidoimidazoline decarboxylase [Ketobacter sp. MCCC 1A13808]RLP52855.1 MAG: 2-oxo-4-hydroxy-4-carboxy-5-ureidoimidazoline decarboxylase [Ketobacter sp.]